MKAVLVHNPLIWYNPATWLYSLIRKVSGSFWNHAVIWTDIENTPCMIDANFHGVIVRGNREQFYQKDKRILAFLEIPSEISEQELKQRLLNLCGKKYDYWVYLRFLLKRNRRNNRLYCFELLANVWKESFDSDKILTANEFEKYIKEIKLFNY